MANRKIGTTTYALGAAGLAALAGVAYLATNTTTQDTVSTAPTSADPSAEASTPASPDAAPAEPGDAQAAAVTRPMGAGTAAEVAEMATAQASGASVVAFDDDSLSFEARMPAAATGDPVLAYLQKDAEGYLRRIRFNARADIDRMKALGRTAEKWEVRVNWEYVARAGDYVSLVGEASEYAAGAPMKVLFDTHIANARTGEEVELVEIFKPPLAPSPATVTALCEALKTAKRARINADTVFDEPIACVGPNANIRMDEARIALAPSDIANKFGGLYVYYAPEAVGTRAEGEYRLVVQQEVFAEDLRPAFKALFAGTAPNPG